MLPTSSVEPELLTSVERWRRWEQRGQDNDARLMRRMRYLFWTSVVVMAAVLAFLR
jgi:nicotinamide riboside transporter PnuC